MAKARRRTQIGTHHRGKHTDRKKGGSDNWVASLLSDKTFLIITDFLTMVMSSGLLGLCLICCVTPSSAAARYGFPPSKTAQALATAAKDGALSTVASVIGFVLEYRGKKGKEDTGLRSFSLILLVVIAVRWGMLLTGPMAKGWMSMLDGSNIVEATGKLAVMAVVVGAIAAVWWDYSSRCSGFPSAIPDFELAKMELQRLASEEEVLSRKQRSRLARVKYEAKKALESKQKSEKASKTSKKSTDAIKPTRVTDAAAADTEVGYGSDSGYSNSGDEDQGVPVEDAEHNLCSDCCVCLEEGAATRAIMPCRHLCLCADCENIGLELCPICREEIADIVQVADGDEDDYF